MELHKNTIKLSTNCELRRQKIEIWIILSNCWLMLKSMCLRKSSKKRWCFHCFMQFSNSCSRNLFLDFRVDVYYPPWQRIRLRQTLNRKKNWCHKRKCCLRLSQSTQFHTFQCGGDFTSTGTMAFRLSSNFAAANFYRSMSNYNNDAETKSPSSYNLWSLDAQRAFVRTANYYFVWFLELARDRQELYYLFEWI